MSEKKKENPKGDRVLMQWWVKPSLKEKLDKQARVRGFTQTRRYLLELAKKDGVNVEISEV